MALNFEQLGQLRRDGYVVLRGFLDARQVDSLRAACATIVDQMSTEDRRAASLFCTNDRHTERLRAKDRYFLESGDKVRFFWELPAAAAAASMSSEPPQRPTTLNKIGHALHWLVPEFRAVTFSERVRACCRSLGLRRPVVCQSMYIMKAAGVGGAVSEHRDATFLHVQPPTALYGLWIAMDDADESNGCLWFRPGSQCDNVVRKRFVRRPCNGGGGDDGGVELVFEGSEPDDASAAGGSYVAVPARRGDCVLISGLVLHRSEANTSSRSRHAYTFHVYDTRPSADESSHAVYSSRNWLQPSATLPFPLLYSDDDAVITEPQTGK